MIKSTNDKKISIIVPFYNVEPFARRCIDSILNQTYKNLEIILIDDGSPDKCGEICDEYAKRDKRIKVVHQENKGLCSARNKGLSLATGEYIGFVDSDDWINEDMYEYLLDGLVKNEADISVCGYYRAVDGEELKENKVDRKYIFNNNQAIVNLVSTFKIRGFFWNKLFKKDIFNEIKFPEGIYYEGTYLMHIILGKINKIVVLPSAKYYYYYFKESATKIKTPEKQLDYVNNLIKRYNDLYREYEELIPKMRKEILRECGNLITIYYKRKINIRNYEEQNKRIGEFLIDNNMLKKSNKLKFYRTLKKKDLYLGYYLIKIRRLITKIRKKGKM